MRRRHGLTALLGALLLTLAIGPALHDASGQYFGRNKVQYEQFDFAVLKTDHFDIYYYEEERDAALQVGRMAERWYARLSRVLDHELRGRQPIVLYASHPHFEQTNAVPGQIGEATGGVTEFLKRRIVLPLAGSMKETDHVLGHELVHAFQFDLTGSGPGATGPSGVPGALRLPLWFIEGMAEYLSVGNEDSFTAMWMRGAAQAERLPSMNQLANPRFFPYRYGHSLWAYIGGRWGDNVVGSILRKAGRTGQLRSSMMDVLGVHPDTVVEDWHRAIREHSAPIFEATSGPTEFAAPLVHSDSGASDVNVGPSLSPDGSEMVFISERSRISVELFLADARTGEVKRKLTETALDPHFQSLQYLHSAGAWGPDGRRFALAAVVKGQPVLTILDVGSGEKVREYRFAQLGEIFNPTWSPDGDEIAFTAQVGGYLDLYVADLETGRLRRLTNDPFAALHPAWSPGGERIAFVTDRFGADVSSLRFGHYRLAFADPESGEVEEAPGFSSGKHINPQWSPDGSSLYFISDRNGIPNVYRLDVASREIVRLTNLDTGAAGFTGLSPALSVARGSGDLVFSVHGGGNFVFDLYRVDAARAPEGVAVTEETDQFAGLNPAILPPSERPLDAVSRMLANAQLGLADTLTFETRDYEASLSLDYVGRPTLAVGASDFGFFFGGGGSVFFSDMLGNRSLAVLAQLQNTEGKFFESSALLATYTNLRRRWNWGVVGGQIPFISRRFGVRSEIQGDDFIQEFTEFTFWEIRREVTGLVQYPFSTVQRVELSGGFLNLDFASKSQTFIFRNGRFVSEEEKDDVAEELFGRPFPAANMARASAALVYDNAIFGGTGPILGQRYRLEVTPHAGDLTFYQLRADYRRYVMPLQPITLAARVLHFGRYGGDSESFPLREFFLGFSSLIRGYDAGSFDFSECGAEGCPVFEQLLGSRVAVFNGEVRLPLLGPLGLFPSGAAPPLDLVGFYDAGVAWTRGTEPDFLNGTREVMESVGGGGRLNLFGLAVIETGVAFPLDRPRKSAVWYLSLAPGF